MRPPIRAAALAAALLLAAPPAHAQRRPASVGTTRAVADTAALLAEARAFMEGYARDLLAGDRAAIVARYDPEGATFMGMGSKERLAPPEIAARYAAPRWAPPASFAWRDLSYEVLGPAAVLVTGRFEWGDAAGRPPVRASYTGVLRRGPRGLRLRLEDESIDPASLPERPAGAGRDAARDTTRTASPP